MASAFLLQIGAVQAVSREAYFVAAESEITNGNSNFCCFYGYFTESVFCVHFIGLIWNGMFMLL